jgi:hypothetical protein
MVGDVLDPPAGLTAEQVALALRRHWAIDAEVEYAPLGYGSYNWTASVAGVSRWFVKANPTEGNFDFFRATYRTARALHDAGLTFVSAALPDCAGDLRCRTCHSAQGDIGS